MNDNTKAGLGVLMAALAMGALADGLARATPWGLNTLLWTGALVAAVMALARWQQIPLSGGGRWMLLPALLFAACFAWRDSRTLKMLDALAIGIALSMAAQRARAGRVRFMGVGEVGLTLLLTGLNALFGPFLLLFGDICWKQIPRGGGMRQAGAVGRGLLIALPLLLVFGGLFMAADATFERLVRRLFFFDINEICAHAVLIVWFAWLVGGYLRGFLLREPSPALPVSAENTRPPLLGLGIVEMGVALGLLDALFLCFVLIQLRYFFGGQALVIATAGLTAADYARRGFFELVTVAALALPLLLCAHGLLCQTNRAGERLFRALAGAQVALVFVIMVSAMQRMHLYQIGFGLTELRFYTTALMGWLAVVFLWFAATVLRGQRERFAFGALVAGALVLGLLHALNPDAWIVRANVARVAAGRSFDSRYVTGLSADAVPTLLSALPHLSEKDRAQIAGDLLDRWAPWRPSEGERSPVNEDWRAWNGGRWAARRRVRENETALEQSVARGKEGSPAQDHAATKPESGRDSGENRRAE